MTRLVLVASALAVTLACAEAPSPSARPKPLGTFRIEVDPAAGTAVFKRAQGIYQRLDFAEDGDPDTNPPGTIQAITTQALLPGQSFCPLGHNCFLFEVANFTGAAQGDVFLAVDAIVPATGRYVIGPDPTPSGVLANRGGRMVGDLANNQVSAPIRMDIAVPDSAPYAIVGHFWGDDGSTVPVPSHSYPLDADFADALGGPSLVPVGGGSFAGGRFVFPADQGLTLSNAIPNRSSYSLELMVSLDDTSGMRRLVDFQNGASNTGLYVLNGSAAFFDVTGGPGGAFADGVPAHVVITRNVSGLFSVYVDGVLQLQFNDALGRTRFPPGVPMRFFVDDTAVGGQASSGAVDFINVYYYDLSPAEIASL